MAMANLLESLAPELLLDVLSYIDQAEEDEEQEHDNRRKDLCAICLTSRTLCALATPLLYSSFYTNRCQQSFWPFARTLSARPDLVHELLLACGSGCITALNVAILCLATSVRELEIAQDSVLGTNEEPSEEEKCRCCPVLADWLYEAFSLSQGSRYPNLTSVTLVGKNCNITDYKLARLFLQLPQVMELGCSRFGTAHDAVTWDMTSVNASQLRKLSIVESWPNTSDLIGLVRCCEDLESLNIVWDDTNHWEAPAGWVVPPVVQLSNVLNATQVHRKTLKSLYLHSNADPALTHGTVGGLLYTFDALTTLRLDREHIVGQQSWAHADMRLPPTLEHLMIDTYGAIDDLPDLLLAVSQAECTGLVSVVVRFPVHDGINNDWQGSVCETLGTTPQEHAYGLDGVWQLFIGDLNIAGKKELIVFVSGLKTNEFCANFGRVLQIEGAMKVIRTAAVTKMPDLDAAANVEQIKVGLAAALQSSG
ncbi:hypothetical protein LTR10_000692 [Elasticomyces elasticus]|nr:hypothetical protein LTR10_000692 [Elasticomyces elasticus]KAK4980061.1 hypothetical protein LTR42_000368 [Elasticomyces elasticus]